MGAGGMLGIVGIIGLVTWWVIRLIRSHKKVTPEGEFINTPPIGKTKVAPLTTTLSGLEDLETKVPSEEAVRRPQMRQQNLQEPTPVNRLLPTAMGKADKSVKIVNNYEPLTFKAGDTSQKLLRTELASRGDSLKHKDSAPNLPEDSSPMKPVPLEKKNTALEVLQKKREEIQQALKTPAKYPIESQPDNQDNEGESSYWESDAKSASQWGSSSVVWSTWSKLDKNKAGQLPPLETSVIKNKKDSSTKKPLREQSP